MVTAKPRFAVTRLTLTFGIMVSALFCCVRANAGDARPSKVITAREALTIALEHNPEVAVARQQWLSERGRQRETAGRLDPALRFNPSFAGLRGELIPAGVRQQTGNRTLLESLDREFSEIAEQLDRELAASPATVSLQCGLGNEILINNRNICEDPEVARERRRLDDLLSTLSRSAGGDGDLQLDIGELQDDLRRSNRRFMEQLVDTLRTVARGNRNARRDLGEVPENEITSTLTLDLSWFHPLDNGWTLTPQLIFESKQDNFEGKPRSSRFGGKGLKMATRSAIGLSVTAPLGRGGADAIRSEQGAARLRADASAQALRFAAQRTSFRILDLYWRLVAAERQLALLEAQIEARTRLVTLASALLAADEISRAETIEPTAQLRQAIADRIQAEQQLLDSNEALRLALGAELSATPRLEPSSDWPEFRYALNQACLPELSTLTEGAQLRRGDLRSLELSRMAAEQESEQARDALRARLDLSLTLAYSGREENEAIFQGYEESLLGGLAGPSVILSISGELDPRNRRAQGALTSSLEIMEQARLRHDEAEAQLRRELMETRNRVLALAQEGMLREQTLASFQTLLADTRVALEAGELDPATALTTELQAFDAEVGVLSLRQRFASAVAELGFRGGAMLSDASAPEPAQGAEQWPWPCP